MLARYKNFIKGGLKNMSGNWEKNQLTYISESASWVINEIGISIINSLYKQNLLKAQISPTQFGTKDQIIHFASINTFFNKQGWNKPHKSNKVIVTWFHIVPGDKKIELIQAAQQDIDLIHTACNSTKSTLISAGVAPEKIIVIPLGVNTELFQPGSEEKKRAVRKLLKIPEDRIVIGSFQKDGNGWDEGLEPKMEKGPDIFVQTVEQLQQYNPFVLLVGPARGYVKHEIEKRGIEYKHIYLKNFQDVARMYHAIDLYIIASRVEGGPKAILESWASGVPLVSTKVGMVPDIVTDSENALLAEVEDADTLAKHSDEIILNSELRRHLVEKGLETVQKFSWDKITQRYYNELYKKVL